MRLHQQPFDQSQDQSKESLAIAKKLTLVNNLCPGDILVMSACLECLHRQYPGKYLTDVETSCNAIFEHNPHITPLNGSGERRLMEYNAIHSSNQTPVHFIEGYIRNLAQHLSVTINCTVNRPYLYLSDDEKRWINQVEETTGYKGKFWLINAGTKSDFTVKRWGLHNWQAVVDHYRGLIQFVQVGSVEHDHKPLDGVISLLGKTDTRQLIRLAYNAVGGIGGVSFLHHIFAALEKPFVCVASGMEPASWERYNTECYLTMQGRLPCCKSGGCWKSKVSKTEKGGTPCDLPVFNVGQEPLPRCMVMITAADVVRGINSYYEGGTVSH